jgi:hypothetical protein
MSEAPQPKTDIVGATDERRVVGLVGLGGEGNSSKSCTREHRSDADL